MRRLWAAFANAFSSATSPTSLSSGVVERLLCEQSVSGKGDVLEAPPHVAEREKVLGVLGLGVLGLRVLGPRVLHSVSTCLVGLGVRVLGNLPSATN